MSSSRLRARWFSGRLVTALALASVAACGSSPKPVAKPVKQKPAVKADKFLADARAAVAAGDKDGAHASYLAYEKAAPADTPLWDCPTCNFRH